MLYGSFQLVTGGGLTFYYNLILPSHELRHRTSAVCAVQQAEAVAQQGGALSPRPPNIAATPAESPLPQKAITKGGPKKPKSAKKTGTKAKGEPKPKKVATPKATKTITKKAVKKRAKAPPPPAQEQAAHTWTEYVCEATRALATRRKAVSAPKLMAYIKSEFPSALKGRGAVAHTDKAVKSYFKKALKKALEDGGLKKIKNSYCLA